jgi:O-acetyl-ADP-ribose deacetylase (regulator of RNase III)
MIKYKIADLLEDKEINVIAHVCNPVKIFGAGVALAIKNKYPEAYQADLDSPELFKDKVGKFSFAATEDGKIIYNLYAMKGLGTQERQLDYEALYSCLESLKQECESYPGTTIGFPYKMGAALAGGNWILIERMIEVIFGDSDLNIIICDLPKFKHEINWANVNC